MRAPVPLQIRIIGSAARSRNTHGRCAIMVFMTGTNEQSAPAGTIRVSALVLRAEDTILMVRKRGTAAFMLPGGKPEPGESPLDAVIREVDEELGLAVAPADLEPLGTFTAAAANESDHRVVGDVFVHRDLPAGFDRASVRPQAEIADVAWFDPHALPDDTPERTFAPLTRGEVLPALARRDAQA